MRDVDLTPLGPAEAFFDEGLTFTLEGHIWPTKSGRVEYGITSYDAIVVGADAHVAQRVPDGGVKHTVGPVEYTLRGEPGINAFWFWWVVYEDGDDIPDTISHVRYYLSGDGEDATFHGTERPDKVVGNVGYLDPEAEPLPSVDDVFQATPDANYTSYHLRFENLLDRPLEGWLRFAYSDFPGNRTNWVAPAETIVHEVALAPGEVLEFDFERPAWADDSDRALDQFSFVPVPGALDWMNQSFELTRGDDGIERVT